jgi:protein TonB
MERPVPPRAGPAPLLRTNLTHRPAMPNTQRFLAGTLFLLGALHAASASAAAAEPPLLPSDMIASLLNAAPAYPDTSRRLREQGRVVVRVLVSLAGEPAQVGIGQSSGFNRLDRAAMDAVQGWHFTLLPTEDDSAQVAQWFSVPINFALADGAPAAQAAPPQAHAMTLPTGGRGEN